MARWLSRSSSFTASGRKSLPDTVCLSRSPLSAAAKRSARSHTDGSGRRSARAWMPRISSRINTSFSRNACGSRAGSFMMARSWPAFSRASPRNCSSRAASMCMTSLSTSLRRGSGGSMMASGSNAGAAGFVGPLCTAEVAASGEAMVVARCCSSSIRRIVAVSASDARAFGNSGIFNASIFCVLSAGASRALLNIDASFSAGMDGIESSVTSSGPNSNSPVSIGGSGSALAGFSAFPAFSAFATTGIASGAATGAGAADTGSTTGTSAGATTTGSALATKAATFRAGRVPVSPASRFAKVSSSSTGTSMVSGMTRGAEIRSIETMM